MRIIDWVADVGSSDLDEIDRGRARLVADEGYRGVHVVQRLRGSGDGRARPITAILGVPRTAVATDVERPDVATALRKIVEPRSPVEPQRVVDAARQRRTMQQQHRGAAVAIGGVCARNMNGLRRVLPCAQMAFRFGGGGDGSPYW